MKSTLRKKTVRIEALGRDLEICELSQLAARIQQEDETGRSGVIVCKHCVPEWKDESLEDLEANLSFHATQEIVMAVFKLSGVDRSKNSESATTDDSSTDSE